MYAYTKDVLLIYYAQFYKIKFTIIVIFY